MSETSPNERERYFLNAKGDFYVENGICLCCMIPEIEAPELMGFNKEQMHCYFKQQPLSSQEQERAIAAVAASDIQGLRYAGSDEYILSRLVELGAADCCDVLTPKAESKATESRSGFVRMCLRRLFE